jgi:hypothetical protein
LVMSLLPHLPTNQPTTAIMKMKSKIWVIFWSVLVTGSLLSVVYSLSAGILIPSCGTKDYSLMLQSLIPYEMRCRYYPTPTASWDEESNTGDMVVTKDRYIGVLSTEWTCTNQPLFRLHLLGLHIQGMGFIHSEWCMILSFRYMAKQFSYRIQYMWL